MQAPSSTTRAVYASGYEDVWLVHCRCGHTWVYDLARKGDQVWGCSACGEAAPETATREESA